MELERTASYLNALDDASTDATTRGIINQGSVTVTLRRQTAELPFGFGVGTGVSPFVLVAVAVVHDTVVDVPVRGGSKAVFVTAVQQGSPSHTLLEVGDEIRAMSSNGVIITAATRFGEGEGSSVARGKSSGGRSESGGSKRAGAAGGPTGEDVDEDSDDELAPPPPPAALADMVAEALVLTVSINRPDKLEPGLAGT
eukprot:gene4575-12191_t